MIVVVVHFKIHIGTYFQELGNIRIIIFRYSHTTGAVLMDFRDFHRTICMETFGKLQIPCVK